MSHQVLHDELTLKIVCPADDDQAYALYEKIVERFFRFTKDHLNAENDYMEGTATIKIINTKP